MPVENNAFGGKPSGNGCETKRAKGGEDSRESRDHGVLKLRSARVEIRIHEVTLPDLRDRRMRPDQQKSKRRMIRGISEEIACGNEQLGDVLVITYLTPFKWDTYLIHMLAHNGTKWRGERLEERRQAKQKGNDRSTYYMTCSRSTPANC